MSLVVQLPKFEGPLALLLYLIRKEEMDIFDIKIHEITHQYLEYIKIMKELDLELAGEFVAMAATLIQIKSRMLLPQYDEKGEVIEVEDPRKELVQKLLEYQKYQEAAKLLYERPLVGRDMWTRGFRESLDEPPEEIEVEDNGLFSLISMYRLIMRSAKKRIHQVTAKAQSIASRILEIKEKLVMGQRTTLNNLVEAVEDKSLQVLITFLSLLELGKLGFISLYQSENYSDIWVDLRKPIEGDVVSSVEEYDTINSQDVASKLFGANPDEVDHTKDAAEDFVLTDAEDVAEQTTLDEPLFSNEDMASDEEILMAERELAGELNVEANPETDQLLSEVEGDSAEIPMAEEMSLQTEINIDEVRSAEEQVVITESIADSMTFLEETFTDESDMQPVLPLTESSTELNELSDSSSLETSALETPTADEEMALSFEALQVEEIQSEEAPPAVTEYLINEGAEEAQEVALSVENNLNEQTIKELEDEFNG